MGKRGFLSFFQGLGQRVSKTHLIDPEKDAAH